MKKLILIMLLLVGSVESVNRHHMPSDAVSFCSWCDSLSNAGKAIDTLFCDTVTGIYRDSIKITDGYYSGQCYITQNNKTIILAPKYILERKAIGGRYIIYVNAEHIKLIGTPNSSMIRWAADTANGFNFLIYILKSHGNDTIYGLTFDKPSTAVYNKASGIVIDTNIGNPKPTLIQKCIFKDIFFLYGWDGTE